jgi:hypothetical protein
MQICPQTSLTRQKDVEKLREVVEGLSKNTSSANPCMVLPLFF